MAYGSGTWGPVSLCPGDYDYVVSFRILSQSDQGAAGDDTAMNGMEMKCKDGAMISDKLGGFGTWSDFTPECANGFTGSTIQIEPAKVNVDFVKINIYTSFQFVMNLGYLTKWETSFASKLFRDML